MDDLRFEQMLARLLRADFSAETGPFRDELLARCLTILNADAHDGPANPAAGGTGCVKEPPAPGQHPAPYA